MENKYRFEIDSKILEIEKISEQYFESKRLHQLSSTQVETSKMEYEKVISDIKKRHQEELTELVSDNHSLQLRIEDASKDREMQR